MCIGCHCIFNTMYCLVQSRLAITRSSGGMFSNRVISEARYRISLCSQVLYIKATSLSSISL